MGSGHSDKKPSHYTVILIPQLVLGVMVLDIVVLLPLLHVPRLVPILILRALILMLLYLYVFSYHHDHCEYDCHDYQDDCRCFICLNHRLFLYDGVLGLMISLRAAGLRAFEVSVGF